jgi:hypothetical protein
LAKEVPKMQELHDQIRAAPSSNRQFHASDLCRLIGQAAYDEVHCHPCGAWTRSDGWGDLQMNLSVLSCDTALSSAMETQKKTPTSKLPAFRGRATKAQDSSIFISHHSGHRGSRERAMLWGDSIDPDRGFPCCFRETVADDIFHQRRFQHVDSSLKQFHICHFPTSCWMDDAW